VERTLNHSLYPGIPEGDQRRSGPMADGDLGLPAEKCSTKTVAFRVLDLFRRAHSCSSGKAL
jgi:hypothetical protein